MLTQERLKELLHYDPETGVFTWLKAPVRLAPKLNGKEAGNFTQGYVNIRVDGVRYRAHRLAWLYVHGRFPEKYLDHINRQGNDNRISNLRECTQSQNMINKTPQRNNTSGVTGVSWDRGRNKWVTIIKVNGRYRHQGRYVQFEDAVAARYAAERKYFGEFSVEAAR